MQTIDTASSRCCSALLCSGVHRARQSDPTIHVNLNFEHKDKRTRQASEEQAQEEEQEEQMGTLTGQAPETAARGSESFVRRRLLLQPLLLLLHVACGPKAKPTQRGSSSQTVGRALQATGLFASCLICAQSAAAAVRVSIRRFRAGHKTQTIPKPSSAPPCRTATKRFGPQLGLRSSLQPPACSLEARAS